MTSQETPSVVPGPNLSAVADAEASKLFLGRGWVCEAPKLQDVLADEAGMAEREAVPYYSLLHANEYAIERGEPYNFTDFRRVLAAHTEAEVLRDLQGYVLQHRDDFAAYDGQSETAHNGLVLANRFLAEVRYIGEQELTLATRGIARAWFDRLSKRGAPDMHVVVEEDGSSALVYYKITEAIRDLMPDRELLGKIRTVNLGEISGLRNKPILPDAKVVLLDDWNISGEQMTELVERLSTEANISNTQVEVNLVCGTAKAIRKGIHGARVRSYYRRPHTADEPYRKPSLFGHHCTPDYGFEEYIDALVSHRDALNSQAIPELPQMRRPYAYKAASVYKRSDVLGASTGLATQVVDSLTGASDRITDTLIVTMDGVKIGPDESIYDYLSATT